MNARHLPCLFAPILLAALAIAPPTRAGSVSYEFTDVHWPYPEIGRMEVDDGALGRGLVTEADVMSFGLQTFVAADLLPFALPIYSDGTPVDFGTIGASRDFFGTTYTLTVDFSPDSFDPDIGGFWQATTAGSPGVYGYGYWTVTAPDTGGVIVAAGVPEPASLNQAIHAAVLAAFIVYYWTTREGSDAH